MLISVVIPSYNHKQYVLRAIESVLEQTWKDVEIIVIDDGSTDGSVEAIQEFLDVRGGFRFVARENRGLVNTLNEGLSLAHGELFCELASDDYFPVDSLEKRTRFLVEHPECVAVFGDGVVIRDERPTGERVVNAKRQVAFSSKDPIPQMLQGALPVFSTGLIWTKVLREAGGFDQNNFRYYEDLDTPVRLIMSGRLGYLDEVVICRRLHGSNVSSSTAHIRTEKVFFYSKLLSDPAFELYYPMLRNRLRRSYLALGRHLDKNRGGTQMEREVFRRGWPLAWQDPRLFWYLLRWGR